MRKQAFMLWRPTLRVTRTTQLPSPFPRANLLIDHFELFELRQVFLHLRGVDDGEASFVTPALYRRVRHPNYTVCLICFWATPVMTVGYLLFAAVTSAYILVAIPFEERDLVATFGDAYRRYKAATPSLIPLRFAPARVGTRRPRRV